MRLSYKNTTLIIALFIVLPALVISIIYIKNEAKVLTDELNKNLRGIVKLKTAQIENWYLDEMQDVELIATNNFLYDMIMQLSSNVNKSDTLLLHTYLENIKKEQGCNDVRFHAISILHIIDITEFYRNKQ